MLSSNWNPVFKLRCWDSFTLVRKRLWSWWDGYWGHNYWMGQWNFSCLLDTALPQKHCARCVAYARGQVENSFLFGFWTETIWNHSIDAVINLEPVLKLETVIRWLSPSRSRTQDLGAGVALGMTVQVPATSINRSLWRDIKIPPLWGPKDLELRPVQH